MIERYRTKPMSGIWSDQVRFENWVKVEVAVLRAKAKLGLIREVDVPDGLENTISVDVGEINRIEEMETKHDVMAFLRHTTPQLPQELQPYWHDKLTSYDIQDTGLSLQLVASVNQLLSRLRELMAALKTLAEEHKSTAMIGRTHAVHAEPITFGVKIANWYDELHRQENRLIRVSREVAVGKISGAVGMYTLPPIVELEVCNALGLSPIISSQVIGRDLHALYLATLAIVGGTLSKISIAARLMQQTEVREAQEFFSEKQDGSSAMPHKRNPVGWENMTGLVRILRGNTMVGFENQDTWHERDISNSAPERIVLPDSSHVLDYILQRMTKTAKQWVIFPAQMERNLDLTRGLVFSQQVQSLLARKSSLPRNEAHRFVKEVAMYCWDSGKDFKRTLGEHPGVAPHITSQELDECFDITAQLEHVDFIFRTVFN